MSIFKKNLLKLEITSLILLILFTSLSLILLAEWLNISNVSSKISLFAESFFMKLFFLKYLIYQPIFLAIILVAIFNFILVFPAFIAFKIDYEKKYLMLHLSVFLLSLAFFLSFSFNWLFMASIARF